MKNDRNCTEITQKHQCVMGNTFSKMKNLLTNRNISIPTRIRTLKCFVWSSFLYACETWTLSSTIEKRIEAMEMWMYRRMGRISWKEKMSNEKVLDLLGIRKTEILSTNKKRKMAYYGHIRQHESIQKRILKGKVESNRERGGKR